MKNFLHKYKWWIVIVVFFVIVRIVLFSTFWQASATQGGWNNFYGHAQPADSVLMTNFYDYCDWHPPLYYTFTSFCLVVLGSQWFIYISQLLLAFVSLLLIYKICHLFFSKNVSLVVTFLMAIEPFWAWHNFLLVSENLYIPLFLSAMYFFFKGFLKSGERSDVIYSALFFGIASLVRLNSFLLPAFLSIALIFLFLLKKKLGVADYLPAINFKQLLVSILIFNAVFFAVLAPWAIRNKVIYGRLTISNIISTNFYFYNLPALISLQENISRSDAVEILKDRADRDLGRNIASEEWDCKVFEKEEFKQHLRYYKTEAKQYIFNNLSDYIPMYLVKALPFFLQSGYFDVYSAYTDEYSKPNMTDLILKRDFTVIKEFVTNINLKMGVYLGGIIFWGLTSLLVVVAFFHSYLRDKKRFIFMFFASAIILYSAFLSSPSVSVRHRICIIIFFFTPMVYAISQWFKKREREE